MLKYLLLATVSFCASFALTPLVRALALRIGAVDPPGERKIHRFPVPRLGGVSIVFSLGLGVLFSLWFQPISRGVVLLEPESWMPVLSGGAIVFLIGIWDDIRPVPAWLKFLFQAAAACVAIWFGILVEHVSLLGGSPLSLGLLAVPVTFLWIVGITNAFNLVDGLDGLAVGLAIIAAGTSATIFLLRGDAGNALFLVMLVGALAGFLRYNFNPATIFLGDSGSLVVGYILAVTAVAGSQKPAVALAVVIPLLIFGLPIVDTLLSMLRRFVGGLPFVQPYKAPLKQRIRSLKRMFEADKSHIHHRLLAMGFSHRNAVLLLYISALTLSLLALISLLAQYRNAGIIVMIVGLATYIGIHRLGYEEVLFPRAGTLLRWYEQFAFNRRFFLGFIDVILVSAAYWGAFVLKHDFMWTRELKEWYLGTFPLVLLIHLGVFLVFGLYRGVWRAMGVGDLIHVGLVVLGSVVLSYSIAVISDPPGNGALTFFCINVLLLETLVLGTRSAYRILNYVHQHEEAIGGDVLIYGAGSGGQFVLRELVQTLRVRPMGFIDDEPTLCGRTINRVPVLGSSNDLGSLLEKRQVAALIISSGKINRDRLQKVIRLCRERQVALLQCSLNMEPVGEESRIPTPASRKDQPSWAL